MSEQLETLLADCHVALSKLVEQLQRLPAQAMAPETASLFRVYLVQADTAITKACRG